MNEQFVHDAMTVLLEAADAAMFVEGINAVSDIKSALKVPVEYRGDVVIRSLPGEAPRRETGDLQGSIDAKTIDGQDGPDSVTLEVSTNIHYAPRLETTRPFMGPAFERMSADLPGALASRMARSLNR